MKPRSPRGLGDTIANLTGLVGLRPCRGCRRRQRWLNHLWRYKEVPEQDMGVRQTPRDCVAGEVPLDLKQFFERCYVISLTRRQDRLQAFRSAIAAAGWPFSEPVPFVAIDGQQVPAPHWWRPGAGAWGVFRSHLAILESCLNKNVSSVLILEDDAAPREGIDFSAACAAFVTHLPADWEMVYLGGQHLHQPQRGPDVVNEHVRRPFNVNRLHAYGLNRAGMEIVYRHLCDLDWQQKHHIDHHLGRLHMGRAIEVYAPSQWLLGQAAGRSDICLTECPLRFWDGQQPDDRGIEPGQPAASQQIVAVVGPPRSGTSCISGILHALGVSMGRKFVRGTKHNPKGYFEAAAILRSCQRWFKHPEMIEQSTSAERIPRLKRWAEGRRGDGPVIGVKHPCFCLMVPDLVAAWPGVKIVVAERPAADAVASLLATGWWGNKHPARLTIPRMIAAREQALDKLKPAALRLAYADVLRDPAAAVERLVAFCGIAPTPEQRAAAIAFVEPRYNHHTAVNRAA